MQKQKHSWNWSVKYFLLRIWFSKISLFGIVSKRLKLPIFFNCLAQTFPTHKHMDVRRGAGIWKFQQEMLFSKFRAVKSKFHYFWPPVEKLLEKSTSGPPWKNYSDAHAHKHVKWHHFCEKLCCITPSGNTVQQHQCGKQSTARWQTVHGVFCQTITNPAELQM